MPNWCYNTVHITGGKNILDKLQKIVKSEDREFDFDKIIPQPAIVNASPNSISIKERESYHGYSWYDWRCEHWNTKWNAAEIFVDRDDNELTYRFNTAWDVPWPVLIEITQQFEELDFEFVIDYEDYYSSPSYRVVIENGKLVSFEEKKHVYEENEDGAAIDHSDKEEWIAVDSSLKDKLIKLIATKFR